MKSREEALAAHELARTWMTERWKTTFTPFKRGDKVWLDTRNVKTNYNKKIALKREEPFEIVKVIGPVTYQLKLPETWKIHNVFHAALLWQYRETEVYWANYTKPPPELVEGEEVYEVENILKHQRQGRGYQYYVKWKGYPIEEASWELEEVFSDNGDLLNLYKDQHQLWTSQQNPQSLHFRSCRMKTWRRNWPGGVNTWKLNSKKSMIPWKG